MAYYGKRETSSWYVKYRFVASVISNWFRIEHVSIFIILRICYPEGYITSTLLLCHQIINSQAHNPFQTSIAMICTLRWTWPSKKLSSYTTVRTDLIRFYCYKNSSLMFYWIAALLTATSTLTSTMAGKVQFLLKCIFHCECQDSCPDFLLRDCRLEIWLNYV